MIYERDNADSHYLVKGLDCGFLVNLECVIVPMKADIQFRSKWGATDNLLEKYLHSALRHTLIWSKPRKKTYSHHTHLSY